MINRLLAFIGRHLDRQLLVLVTILLAIGLLVLFSASGANAERTGAHAINIGIALTIMWIAANIPLYHLANVALPLYLVGLLLLIAVELVGLEVNGAQRWLNLGFTRIQPSELMKLFLVVYLAGYLVRHHHDGGQRDPHRGLPGLYRRECRHQAGTRARGFLGWLIRRPAP